MVGVHYSSQEAALPWACAIYEEALMPLRSAATRSLEESLITQASPLSLCYDIYIYIIVFLCNVLLELLPKGLREEK
jgi:hypothetical protein